MLKMTSAEYLIGLSLVFYLTHLIENNVTSSDYIIECLRGKNRMHHYECLQYQLRIKSVGEKNPNTVGGYIISALA